MQKQRYIDRIKFALQSTRNGGLDFAAFSALFDMSVVRLDSLDELSESVMQRGKQLASEVKHQASCSEPSGMERNRLLQAVEAWLTEG
jgi:hypothetical protein